MADKPHVLFVDDVQEIADVIKLSLEMEGFDVTVASNGEEAMSVLLKGKMVDVLVLDYMMPRLNGVEFLQRICQDPRLNHTKVILASAALPKEEDWWKRLGGNSLRSMVKGNMTKPYDGAQLAAAIRKVLDEGTVRRLMEAVKHLPETRNTGFSLDDQSDVETPPTFMPMSSGKRRILVVEDDNTSGPAITDMLRGEGYGVGWCMDRKTMREFISREPSRAAFDVLLLDLALPDAFGAEILQELSQDARMADVKVVIITGQLGRGEEELFMSRLTPTPRKLVSCILIKPYEWPVLLKAVRRAIETIADRS